MAMRFNQTRATTAIHIRVKRHNDTYFVLCDEYETVESVKSRLVMLFDNIGFKLPKAEEDMTVDDIRLCLKNRILDKDSTCHDQQVFNDTELYCLFKKPNTKDEFDDLTEVAGQEFVYDYPLRKKEETKAEDD